MPVEMLDGWPDPRPMHEARRNGTYLLVAFRNHRAGYPPWIAIARWVEPVQNGDTPISKQKLERFQRSGGYWASGYKKDRIIKAQPLAWWDLPKFEEGELDE